LLSPDVSNAGVSSVPHFQPPINPATPIHHTFLGGILARLKGIGSDVVNGVSAPDPSLAGSPDLSEADRQRAKSNALLALGNALLNPQHDARGFRQSTLGALSTGLANARTASDESLGGALNTHAAMVQRAQANQLAARRAALQAQFQILPTDTPEQIDTKVRQLAFGYSQIGDTKSLEALGQAKALFAQPKPAPLPRSLEHVELLDPSGKPAIGLIDPASGEVVKYLPAVPKPDPTARAASADQQDKGIDRVVKTYEHETQDFTKARSGYEVLQGAMKEPNLYSPIAMLDAYARTINPGAIVRPSTMELLEHTGAATDRLRRWESLINKGQWPADLSQALNSSLTSIMKQHYVTAQAARGRALARLKSMHISDGDTYLDPLDFGPNTPGASPAAPASAPATTTSSNRGNY
jgi:hypothetical protein